jgi:Predicted integral membrane protein (DUF2269)
VHFDDWILALHVLSAVFAGAAVILFWILVFALRRTDLPDTTVGINDVARPGAIVIAVAFLGAIVFGVWLAISLDRYQLWDGWVLAALVLWAIGFETGRRSGNAFQLAGDRGRELQAAGETAPNAELSALNNSRTALTMHALSSLAFVLILVDMIWKPGA